MGNAGNQTNHLRWFRDWIFRVMQLGGEGRPEGFSTWIDAFLSQDNYGANTGNNDRSKEP